MDNSDICSKTGKAHNRYTGPLGPIGSVGSNRGKVGISLQSECKDCGEVGLGPNGPRGPGGPTCQTCGYWDANLMENKKFVGQCSHCDLDRTYPPMARYPTVKYTIHSDIVI